MLARWIGTWTSAFLLGVGGKTVLVGVGCKSDEVLQSCCDLLMLPTLFHVVILDTVPLTIADCMQ